MSVWFPDDKHNWEIYSQFIKCLHGACSDLQYLVQHKQGIICWGCQWKVQFCGRAGCWKGALGSSEAYQGFNSMAKDGIWVWWLWEKSTRSLVGIPTIRLDSVWNGARTIYRVGDINNLAELNLTTGYWKPLHIRSTTAPAYLHDCSSSAYQSYISNQSWL